MRYSFKNFIVPICYMRLVPYSFHIINWTPSLKTQEPRNLPNAAKQSFTANAF